MEIPITKEWVAVSKVDLLFLLAQMGSFILFCGILTWLITVIMIEHKHPRKNFRQVSIATLAATLVIGIVSGYYYWEFPKVERRGQQEVITTESIAEQAKAVYDLELIKEVDNEFPDQYEPIPDWWYLFKTKAGVEVKCELVYEAQPKFRKVDGIGWESIFLQVPKYAKKFRVEPNRTAAAKLLCDKKEPTKVS